MTIYSSAPVDTTGLLKEPIYPGQDSSEGTWLPMLSVVDRDALVEGFCDFVTNLNEVNKAQRLWPLTWLSRRDQHNNSLLGDLHFLKRLDIYLDNASDKTVAAIVIDDSPLADLATRLARRKGWDVRKPLRHRAVWAMRSVNLAFRPFICFLALLKYGFEWCSAGSKQTVSEVSPGDATVVISTIFHDHTFRHDAPYRDVYFGDLANWLTARGETCLVIGQVQGNPKIIARGARDKTVPRVETQGRYLRLSDVLSTAWHALNVNFQLQVELPRELSFLGQIETLVRSSLANCTTEIGLSLLTGVATKRVLNENPKARVIRMHENNPWERVVDAAAKDRADPRHVIGYFHCSILPAHLKNIYTPDDAPLYPEPDMVICTGNEARNVYLSMGPRSNGQVASGCDLRNGLEPVKWVRRSAIKRVLVAFEGLLKMRGLLRFVHDAAANLPSVIFVLRAHPAMPLDKIAPSAGLVLSETENMIFSTQESLSDDIAASDALLYQGSTVALTAAAMGKPLFAFDGGSLKPDDPLFASSAMKWAVGNTDDLRQAVTQIEQLSEEDYQAGVQALQDYVNDYAWRANDENMRVFLGGSVLPSTIGKTGVN